VSQSVAATMLAFTLTSLIIEITPGPNMAYLVALSLANGWRVGLAAVAGVAFGLATIGVAAAFGLAAIINESKTFYEILRWLGVGYLLWLAIDMWRSETEISAIATDGHYARLRSAFSRGLVTNLLNPKAAIFYIVVVPTFVRPGEDALRQTVELTAIYVAVATLVHSALALTAGAQHERIARPDRRRKVRRSLALALVAIAVWVAISTAR
jgi:threonine/homoserine/homoserine lactone efflux protein